MLRRYPPAPGYRFWAFQWALRIIGFEPLAVIERLRLKRPVPPPPKPPIFILGFWRSGTTHLQNTLLQDERFAYLKFFHALNPSSFVHTEWFVKPFFDFFFRLNQFDHPAHGIPFALDMPAEEDVAFPADGFHLAPCWGFVMQDHFRELFTPTALLEGLSDDDRELFEAYLSDFIGRLSMQVDHRQLLLKSPPHTARLPMIEKLFPGSRYVFIRRDPYEVFRSNIKLWRSFDDQKMRPIDDEQIWSNIAWCYDRVHANYERDKHLLGDRLIEVTFEELAAEPLEVVKRIYDGLGLGPPPEQKMRAWLLEAHAPPGPSATPAQIAYVNEHLGHWVDHWGYPRRQG